jgi:hypothetical protein
MLCQRFLLRRRAPGMPARAGKYAIPCPGTVALARGGKARSGFNAIYLACLTANTGPPNPRRLSRHARDRPAGRSSAQCCPGPTSGASEVLDCRIPRAGTTGSIPVIRSSPRSASQGKCQGRWVTGAEHHHSRSGSRDGQASRGGLAVADRSSPMQSPTP